MNKQQTNLFACFLLSLLFYGPLGAQPKKACELTDVATINSILGTTLQYDANSIINKSGKYECRYTDPKSPGRYIAIGLLESKVAYGYDMLKTEFDTNQKMTSEGKKAGGKFTKFVAFSKAGAKHIISPAQKMISARKRSLLNSGKAITCLASVPMISPTAALLKTGCSLCFIQFKIVMRETNFQLTGYLFLQTLSSAVYINHPLSF